MLTSSTCYPTSLRHLAHACRRYRNFDPLAASVRHASSCVGFRTRAAGLGVHSALEGVHRGGTGGALRHGSSSCVKQGHRDGRSRLHRRERTPWGTWASSPRRARPVRQSLGAPPMAEELQDGPRQLTRFGMPRARKNLAGQAAQGLGGGRLSHVRPSLLRLGGGFATWQNGFPKLLYSAHAEGRRSSRSC
jgi:hypothetical protein